MMPGNLCTPDFLAETARDIAGRHGSRSRCSAARRWSARGWDLPLRRAGNAAGSEARRARVPRRRRGAQPVVLVGKGLCFDTGGISIKPAERMELMKFDMCGAAGVLGAMEAIARLELPVNVVGIIGATTNMPSGTAVKPGDVVRSMSGKSIEIINTDAEGRLVLADLLSYAQRFEPAAVIDAATLTGRVRHRARAHGDGRVGQRRRRWCARCSPPGARRRSPGGSCRMWDDYKELIKSDVADIKNTGGRAGGHDHRRAVPQGVRGGYPWVHLDIAGTAYSEADLVAMPRGPTGVPVGTFVEFVRGTRWLTLGARRRALRSSLASASLPGPFCRRRVARRCR